MFQSAPLLRGATSRLPPRSSPVVFQSAPLLRGATPISLLFGNFSGFQSAPLLRGATAVVKDVNEKPSVSIRAPLARGDNRRCMTPSERWSFNPRPSCEGRLAPPPPVSPSASFQSAPLLRGATSTGYPFPFPLIVSIRAPLARGDHRKRGETRHIRVSIRAPLARGDKVIIEEAIAEEVSIRAPLARGDTTRGGWWSVFCRFNPRPSCEGRRPWGQGENDNYMFQSAPLLRGATHRFAPSFELRGFNPRPSCEGRLLSSSQCETGRKFQSAPLLRGATRGETMLDDGPLRFNPRPSCEGRLNS